MNCPEKKNLTHPTPGGGGVGGQNFKKSGKFHELPRKSINIFLPPPPVGILGGQKNKSPGNFTENYAHYVYNDHFS